MTSLNYIKSQLSELVFRIPEIRARYENDQSNNTHVIEILPNEIYHNFKEFNQEEEKMIGDFISNFPFENIVFLSGDDDYKIGNEYDEFTGENFNLGELTVFDSAFSNSGVTYFASSIVPAMEHDLFPDFPPVYIDSCAQINKSEIRQIPAMPFVNFINTRSDLMAVAYVFADLDNLNPVYFERAGENNYALSA